MSNKSQQFLILIPKIIENFPEVLPLNFYSKSALFKAISMIIIQVGSRTGFFSM